MPEQNNPSQREMPASWHNAHQTQAERRLKYAILRKAGINASWCTRLRDINWSAIARRWPQVLHSDYT